MTIVTPEIETCDQCGPAVRARFVVTLPAGNVLSYCNHHATEYLAALQASGAFIYELVDWTIERFPKGPPNGR